MQLDLMQALGQLPSGWSCVPNEEAKRRKQQMQNVKPPQEVWKVLMSQAIKGGFGHRHYPVGLQS